MYWSWSRSERWPVIEYICESSLVENHQTLKASYEGPEKDLDLFDETLEQITRY
jgi:hypothetical protein